MLYDAVINRARQLCAHGEALHRNAQALEIALRWAVPAPTADRLGSQERHVMTEDVVSGAAEKMRAAIKAAQAELAHLDALLDA